MDTKFVFTFLTACLTFSGTSFAAESNEAYKLNQGDVLQISVWGEETLQKEVRVLPDGSITFPLAGRVEVANATTPEIEKRITEKLKTYMPDPQVTVAISSIEGNRAFIIGKVLRPGAVLLTGPMTVMQAISQAGGLDRFADSDSIKVLRGSAGAESVQLVNYDRLIKGQDLSSNILLNTGDTILVP